jgi:hypothetical protein
MKIDQMKVGAPGEYFGRRGVLGNEFPTGPRGANKRAYDSQWCYALSQIAGWSYSELPVLVQELAYYGFKGATVTQFAMKNEPMLIVATAYVVEKNGVAVLAFRGTELANIVNWMTDANTALYAFEGKKPDAAQVHSGFYANVEAIWGDVFGYLGPKIEAGEIVDLYITGHSLGAAMAALAAAQIYRSNFKNRCARWDAALCGVYSFAQPSVGDAKFAERIGSQFADRLFRHIFDEDVVPCLPPKAVDADFVHFGRRFFAPSNDGQWQAGGEDRRASLAELGSVFIDLLVRRVDILRGLDQRFLRFSIDDHSPRGYIDVSRNSATGDTSRITAAPIRPESGLKTMVTDWVRMAMHPLQPRGRA